MLQFDLFTPAKDGQTCTRSFWVTGIREQEYANEITIAGADDAEVVEVRDFIMAAMRFYSERGEQAC